MTNPLVGSSSFPSGSKATQAALHQRVAQERKQQVELQTVSRYAKAGVPVELAIYNAQIDEGDETEPESDSEDNKKKEKETRAQHRARMEEKDARKLQERAQRRLISAGVNVASLAPQPILPATPNQTGSTPAFNPHTAEVGHPCSSTPVTTPAPSKLVPSAIPSSFAIPPQPLLPPSQLQGSTIHQSSAAAPPVIQPYHFNSIQGNAQPQPVLQPVSLQRKATSFMDLDAESRYPGPSTTMNLPSHQNGLEANYFPLPSGPSGSILYPHQRNITSTTTSAPINPWNTMSAGAILDCFLSATSSWGNSQPAPLAHSGHILHRSSNPGFSHSNEWESSHEASIPIPSVSTMPGISSSFVKENASGDTRGSLQVAPASYKQEGSMVKYDRNESWWGTLSTTSHNRPKSAWASQSLRPPRMSQTTRPRRAVQYPSNNSPPLALRPSRHREEGSTDTPQISTSDPRFVAWHQVDDAVQGKVIRLTRKLEKMEKQLGEERRRRKESEVSQSTGTCSVRRAKRKAGDDQESADSDIPRKKAKSYCKPRDRPNRKGLRGVYVQTLAPEDVSFSQSPTSRDSLPGSRGGLLDSVVDRFRGYWS
ncbi:hypothetical protein JAAARDRAFT_476888 [Jaapia argillacea MUCL 33604]|uniref:Uncharacterized protein n=1 Tax=Jaapia argillacea MUCL 33604 TaxID=933084 RepID=A0A067PME9_9AGAM|nr:hypothetical protein JAAARDRAFT_476888 [Jaapia argillacea MUCL 33604]